MPMEAADIALRRAGMRDRNAVVALIHELNVVETAYADDRRVDWAAAEAYYQELSQRLEARNGRMVVAEVEGEIVGLMGFSIERDAAYIVRDRNRHGHVTDLVVHPAWRGRGIGRLLLGEAERLAKAAGLTRLAIGVLARNEGAEALYRSFGFGPYVKLLVKDF